MSSAFVLIFFEKKISMFKAFATMLMFFIIFLSTTTISSKAVKIKCMTKIDSPKNKFQFLNVNNFEIILKFLNFDDFPQFLRACEKSKSNYLRQTIRKLFQTFHKTQIQNSIEYVSSEMFHAKQQPKKNSTTKFFEKYLKPKTILLPKFVEHVIQTQKCRIVSHIDGCFSIEQKLENQKHYSLVSIASLFVLNCRDFNSINMPERFFQVLNWTFSSKNFISSILNHQNSIFITFQAGQIFICGETGESSMCIQSNKTKEICHFISKNKTYFISYLKTSEHFVVYHISSGEIFVFENSSLKSIFLNPNYDLDYNFLKNNGKSSGFANSKDYLINQMMTHLSHIWEINYSIFPKTLNPRFNDILNALDNI